MDTTVTENRKFPFAPLVLQVLGLIIYSAAIIEPESPVFRSLHPPLFALILGIGFYMTYRRGYSRLLGIVGLMILLPLAISLIEAGLRISISRSGSFLSLLGENMLQPRRYVIPIAVVAVALAASRWRKSDASFKYFAFLAAGVVLIASFFLIWMGRYFTAPSHVLFPVIVRIVLESLAIPPFALLARALAERGGAQILPSIGARLWCALVFMATTALLIANVYYAQPGMTQSLLLLPATVGAFLLVFGSRSGWYLYLVGFELSVVQTLVMIPMADDQRPALLFSLGGTAVNLFITWLLIRNAPLKPGAEPTGSPRRIPWIIPVIETITGLLGALLAGAAGHSLLTNKRFDEEALIAALIGVVLFLLQGTAAVLGFKKRGHISLHAFCLFLFLAMFGLFLYMFLSR